MNVAFFHFGSRKTRVPKYFSFLSERRAIALSLLAPLVTAAQTIDNADFSSPVIGRGVYQIFAPPVAVRQPWVFSGASGVANDLGSAVSSYSVSNSSYPGQYAFLQLAGTSPLSNSISQVVPIGSAGDYILSFLAAGRVPSSVGSGGSLNYAVRVTPAAGGASVLAATSTSTDNQPFTSIIHRFTIAAPGNYIVSFTTQAGFGTYNDNTVLITNVAIVRAGAPEITISPQSLTVTAGRPAFLSVAATGTPPLNYQWSKNGLIIPGATGASLSIPSSQVSDAGNYVVAVSNSTGLIATSSNSPAILTVLLPAAISNQPTNRIVSVGDRATFTVGTVGLPTPTVQWQSSIDGGRTWSNLSENATFSGVATSTLSVGTIKVAMAGYQFRAVVTNIAGPSATSEASVLNVSASRLVNASVLTSAGTGSQTLILGFGISGIGTKGILTRAIGPSLAQFGVNGTISDPQLALYNPTGSPSGQNNDWNGGAALSAAFAQVGAFALPADSRDSALQVTLPSGTSTVQVSGLGGATGLALAELYDLDTGTPTARLSNFSVRNLVGTGTNILVVGFVISGANPVTLLVRGIGPSLSQFGISGVLPDPRLALYNGTSLLAGNDSWGGTQQLANVFTAVGAFALVTGSRDSALLVTLSPGAYTAQISSISGTTGVGLIEAYEIP